MTEPPITGWRRRDCLAWCATLGMAPLALAQAAAAPALAWSPELAGVWTASRPPRGFAVSEKFDGVRALWDRRVLRFRSGRVIPSVPAWFVQSLPDVDLDGELWLRRGQFDALSGLVRADAAGDEAWRQVRYQVFDAPTLAGTFAQRWQHLRALEPSPGALWRVVEQTSVQSVQALRKRLEEVLQAGGEGLVLHQWDALWRAGRSDAVFKFKPELDDEAQVVGYRAGQGKYAGRTGALLVRDAQGRVFALGSGLSDALRGHPPPIGAWVTYRYQGLTSHGLPRFARFVRVREAE
jgi:DNA ligase 1